MIVLRLRPTQHAFNCPVVLDSTLFSFPRHSELKMFPNSLLY